jgi:hypothetical protein
MFDVNGVAEFAFDSIDACLRDEAHMHNTSEKYVISTALISHSPKKTSEFPPFAPPAALICVKPSVRGGRGSLFQA